MLSLDHIVVCAPDLEEGATWVERRLGLRPEGGGRHGFMGTWNRLLSLGPGCYLEVIAIDPDAAPPGRARWFGLDDLDGPPRLAAWACRGDEIARAAELAPVPMQAPFDAARGDLRWRMALPVAHSPDAPALISWQDGAGAAARLPDRGARLTALHVDTPAPGAFEPFLAALAPLGLLKVRHAAQAGLRARIEVEGRASWL